MVEPSILQDVVQGVQFRGRFNITPIISWEYEFDEPRGRVFQHLTQAM